MKLTTEELAYFAGMVDALAVIRSRQVGETTLIYLAISSSNFGILKEFARVTDIKVTTVNRKYDRVGCQAHCEEPHLHVESVTGRWSVSGIKATVMLRALLPYLRLKTPEARIMLETFGNAPYKLHVLQKMIDLGWPHNAMEKDWERVQS